MKNEKEKKFKEGILLKAKQKSQESHKEQKEICI